MSLESDQLELGFSICAFLIFVIRFWHGLLEVSWLNKGFVEPQISHFVHFTL